MIKSRVLDILKSFSRDDLKQFSEYICSPFFNKRKVIIKLFETYRKYYPDFNDKNLTKEKIFKKIFPDKKYNDEVFRNLNSILLKIAEDFLSFINYSNDALTVKHHLLTEINLRNILNLFEKNFEESKILLEQTAEKDDQYFFHEHNLFVQKNLYCSFINKFSKDDTFHAEKSLVIFFLMKIMEMQNYILYDCRVLGLDNTLFLKDNFIDELLKLVPKNITELPQVRFHYNALKLEQTNKEEYYLNLRSLIKEFGSFIEKEKQYNKYIAMIDYIKRTRPRDDIKTTAEMFELRKDIIEKGLFTDNFMTNMFFLNLVKSGLRLNEFEWVNDFIENYHHLIIDKYRESTTELAYSYFHFEKKEFDESLSHSARVKYEDNFYNLEVRNITARIYFETERYDMLSDFVNSYRMYLAKNRSLSKSDIDNHSLFLKHFGKLLRIKELKKYYKLDVLLGQVNKKDFINRLWMLDKVKELEEIEFRN